MPSAYSVRIKGDCHYRVTTGNCPPTLPVAGSITSDQVCDIESGLLALGIVEVGVGPQRERHVAVA